MNQLENLASQFPQMLEEQNALNQRTAGSDWADKGLPWHVAIAIEVAEAIDSLPWNWRTGSFDPDSLKVKLVDLWHYVLSWAIQERLFDGGGYTPEHIVESAKKILMNQFGGLRDGQDVIDESKLVNLLMQITHHASDPEANEPGCYDLVAITMSKILAAYLYVAPDDPLSARFII